MNKAELIENFLREIKGDTFIPYREGEDEISANITAVVAVINTLIPDDTVLVPRELIQNIDDMTEAGFSAEDEIDKLCALLATLEEG